MPVLPSRKTFSGLLYKTNYNAKCMIKLQWKIKAVEMTQIVKRPGKGLVRCGLGLQLHIFVCIYRKKEEEEKREYSGKHKKMCFECAFRV